MKILNISRFHSETKALIERLILEKISQAGIARARGVSIRWLQNYLNKKYAEISPEISVMKKAKCTICPLRADCTNSKKGRTVSIHPDEALMQELRARQSTASGRLDLRRRTTVEHSLAHIGH